MAPGFDLGRLGGTAIACVAVGALSWWGMQWVLGTGIVGGGAVVDEPPELEESILLRGNAVNYLVKAQDASGIEIGGIKLDPPPKLVEDLKTLQGKGITIRAVEEDLSARGISQDGLLEGVEIVKKSDVPKLFADHDKVFTW